MELGLGDMAILKFELAGVQSAIKKAVMMRANGLSELIDQEVKRAFTPERILDAIRTEVEKEFERSMRYGEGSRIVRKLVEEQIAKTVARLAENQTRQSAEGGVNETHMPLAKL